MNWVALADQPPEINRKVLLCFSHPEDYLAALRLRPTGLDKVALGYGLAEPAEHFYSLDFRPLRQDLQARITHWCYLEKPE